MDRKLRMKLEFPPATLARLERVRRLGGHPTYIDTVRAALKLYEVSLATEQCGDRIIVELAQPRPTKPTETTN